MHMHLSYKNTVFGKTAKVFFQYYFTILQNHKGGGMGLCEITVQRIDTLLAPAQRVGRHGGPGVAGSGRKIQWLRTGIEKSYEQ